MNEILPGVWHWTAMHPPIGARVSSYFVQPAAIVIDPKLPEEGLDAAFADRPRPQQVVLTSGHHLRDSQAFAEAFDIPIRASFAAIEHLGDGAPPIRPFNEGEEVAPGVHAIQIGVLAPDEGGLHLTGVPGGAVALADAIHHYGDALGFFSDELLGAHPDRVKEGLKEKLRALLERDFDAVLFAHGDPLVKDGKAALRRFVSSPVGYPEFGQAL
jgi:hypothetical protein